VGSTDDLGAQVIEERIEAAGGGTVNLIDPPDRIVAAIGHVGHSATSWVMVTPGRIPPWALAAMTRSDVASLASATALLTQTSRTGSTLELGLSGLSHYMADSSGQTEAGIIPGLFVGSNLTLADCAALYIGTTLFSNVRRGTISAGIGAPANVTLDGEHHDSLSFTKWLAYQFRFRRGRDSSPSPHAKGVCGQSPAHRAWGRHRGRQPGPQWRCRRSPPWHP